MPICVPSSVPRFAPNSVYIYTCVSEYADLKSYINIVLILALIIVLALALSISIVLVLALLISIVLDIAL